MVPKVLYAHPPQPNRRAPKDRSPILNGEEVKFHGPRLTNLTPFVSAPTEQRSWNSNEQPSKIPEDGKETKGRNA